MKNFLIILAIITLVPLNAHSGSGPVSGSGGGGLSSATADADYVNVTGDDMTGQLTVDSTVTVKGSEFSVGGSTFMVESGMVGIGTNISGALMEIYKAGSTNPSFRVANANQIWEFQTRGTSSNRFQFMDITGLTVPMIIDAGSPDNAMRISPIGVGIGTSLPLDTLHVNGTTLFKSSTSSHGGTTTNDATFIFVSTAGVTITLSTADETGAGKMLWVADRSGFADVETIVINTEGSSTINGSTSAHITAAYGVGKLFFDGNNWGSW